MKPHEIVFEDNPLEVFYFKPKEELHRELEKQKAKQNEKGDDQWKELIKTFSQNMNLPAMMMPQGGMNMMGMGGMGGMRGFPRGGPMRGGPARGGRGMPPRRGGPGGPGQFMAP